jgi:hypothetical protein
VRYGEPITLAEYRGKRLKSDMIDEMTELVMTEVIRLSEKREDA